jgi:hypothetical protein
MNVVGACAGCTRRAVLAANQLGIAQAKQWARIGLYAAACCTMLHCDSIPGACAK